MQARHQEADRQIHTEAAVSTDRPLEYPASASKQGTVTINELGLSASLIGRILHNSCRSPARKGNCKHRTREYASVQKHLMKSHTALPDMQEHLQNVLLMHDSWGSAN